MENAFNSWRQRSLSYKGKALVINTLALSYVWYVASLIHVPRWVSVELNTLIFKFFWSGKPDLVTRRVVVQPSCLGGFTVVDFQRKVMPLHVHWVRRFVSSLSSWVSFMVFWFSSRLAAPPHLVFLLRFVFLQILCFRVKDPLLPLLWVLVRVLIFVLFLLCLRSLLISFFSLKMLFLLIVRSSFLCLVLFTGLVLGISFSFLKELYLKGTLFKCQVDLALEH